MKLRSQELFQPWGPLKTPLPRTGLLNSLFVNEVCVFNTGDSSTYSWTSTDPETYTFNAFPGLTTTNVWTEYVGCFDHESDRNARGLTTMSRTSILKIKKVPTDEGFSLTAQGIVVDTPVNGYERYFGTLNTYNNYATNRISFSSRAGYWNYGDSYMAFPYAVNNGDPEDLSNYHLYIERLEGNSSFTTVDTGLTVYGDICVIDNTVLNESNYACVIITPGLTIFYDIYNNTFTTQANNLPNTVNKNLHMQFRLGETVYLVDGFKGLEKTTCWKTTDYINFTETTEVNSNMWLSGGNIYKLTARKGSANWKIEILDTNFTRIRRIKFRVPDYITHIIAITTLWIVFSGFRVQYYNIDGEEII